MSVRYENESARDRPERMIVAMVDAGIDRPDEIVEAFRDCWDPDYAEDVLWEAKHWGMICECSACGRYHTDTAYARECCEVRDESYYGVAHLFGAHTLCP